MDSARRRKATSDDGAAGTLTVPGADYVAVVELTNKAGDVLAAVGDTCARVPASSLPWLLECGAIAPRDGGARG